MDKLKAVLLNHGEKLVAGIFALLAIMSLTSASWSTEHRNPNQIVDQTKESTAAIERNVWPDQDKQLFADVPDVESKVRDDSKKLTRPEDFQIGSFNPSIQKAKEKNTAVAVLAPESPRAVALVIPVALPPEEEEEEDPEESTDGKKEEEKSDDELSEEEQMQKLIAEKFGLRKDTAGAGPGAMGEGMAGMLGGEGGYPGDGGGVLGGAPGGYPGGGSGTAAGGYPGGEGGAGAYGMEGMGEGYGGGADMYGGYGAGELFGTYGDNLMSAKKRIRVAAGVSVTMVVDLRKQREILRRALNLTGDYKVAQALIEYVDLKVERRRQQGEGVWDEWEPVSSEDLGEILKESFGIDRDIVSPAVARSTITMPLPRRAAGRWSPNEASHPRVEDYVLSEEEKELIDKWNRRVNEKLEALKKDAPVKVEARGFSQFASTATDAGAGAMAGYGMEMMGSGSGMEMGNPYGDAYNVDNFASSLGEGVKLSDQERELLDETNVTADHRLLLVRFMDFTVERGFAYQYRVRLEMKNPNYEKPLDELADPAIGVAPTLFSDWSQATQPTMVPMPHRAYLTDVDDRGGSPEKASILVYTDTTDTGLPVMGELKSVLMGLPVAGKENIEIVDLTTEEVAVREVSLKTNELLAAARDSGRVSASEHPALRDLISRTRGTPIPDQVCVIDGDGSMKLRSVGDNSQQKKMDAAAFAFLLKEYDAWKKKKSEGSDFFGTEGGGYGADGGEGLGMGYGASAAGGYYGGYGGGGGYGEAGGESGGRSSRRNRGRR